MLQGAVTKVIFTRIMRVHIPKEAWNIIRGENQEDTKVRFLKLQILRRELVNIKLKEDETLNNFSKRFFELRNQMKSFRDH